MLMGVVCCVRAPSLLDGNVTVGVSGGKRARWRPSACAVAGGRKERFAKRRVFLLQHVILHVADSTGKWDV